MGLLRFAGAAVSALQFHALRYGRTYLAVLGVFAIVLGGSYALTRAPVGRAHEAIVVIARGASARAASDELSRAGVLRYPTVLRVLLRVSGQGGSVHAGAYHFSEPENAIEIAYRLVTGSFGIAPTRITYTEGETIRDMAAKTAAVLPGVTAEAFTAAAGGDEGYLFPDTYVFAPDSDAAALVKTMRSNFTFRIAPLLPAIAASGHPLGEIVTMASLVEKEARTPEDRRLVAGILWNRIRRGMPLQVDAVFGYIFSRDTYAPSLADLTVDSPYNTYLHAGLPPGPIDNPGLDSLAAAVEPTASSYLYYLTGTDGQMHYAATYSAHVANQRKYLR